MVVDNSGDKQPVLLFWILLSHFLFYMPSWALTNSIALYQMDNPGKQFPSIRVMGTIGWIFVSAISLFSSQITGAMGISGNIEATQIPMILGSAIGVIAGLLAFMLPNTPPKTNTFIRDNFNETRSSKVFSFKTTKRYLSVSFRFSLLFFFGF